MTLKEIARVASSTEEDFDPHLRPQARERQNDLVWFGVEYQIMNAELARAHGVELPTRGGEIGLRIIHVYPGSPAQKGGFQRGDILLSLTEEGKPEPHELDDDYETYSESDYFGGIPGDIPDDLRYAYLSEMGPPWRSQSNPLNAMLTRMGEGSRAVVKYLRGTKKKTYEFTLEPGPPVFENAPRKKLPQIGLTVKDLTFEVRTCYRLQDSAPGVVISKIESGSPAAVAKLIPYEIISSVNNEPVRNAKDFTTKVETLLAEREKGTTADVELRLERIGKSRLVKLRL